MKAVLKEQFSIHELYNLGLKDTVKSTLLRLEQKEIIIRLIDGLYTMPTYSKIIINNKVGKSEIANAIFEKNFWACFMLEYLFNEFKYRDSICFKGGTSLSKVHGLIKRFSEGIDLVLDWTVLRYDVEHYYVRSNCQQALLNKEMNHKTEILIHDQWLIQMMNNLKQYLHGSLDLY